MRFSEAQRASEIENPSRTSRKSLSDSLFGNLTESLRATRRTLVNHRAVLVGGVAGSVAIALVVGYIGSYQETAPIIEIDPPATPPSSSLEAGKLLINPRCDMNDNINSIGYKPYPHSIIEVILPSGVFDGLIGVSSASTPERTAVAPLVAVAKDSKIVMDEYARNFDNNGNRSPKNDINFSKGDKLLIVLTDKSGARFEGKTEAPC